MSVITSKQLDYYLVQHKRKQLAQIFLIYGERFLVNQSLKKITDIIQPCLKSVSEMEILDESTDNIIKTVHDINTFSLLKNGKVIIIRNSSLFELKESNSQEKKKIGKVYTNENGVKTSISLLNLPQKEFDIPKLHSFIKNNTKSSSIEKLIIPEKRNNSQILEYAIKKGFPDNHHVILLSDIANKENHLFKLVGNKGLIIDCTVPKSRKQSHETIRKSLLHDLIRKILNKNKKNMDGRAYKILYDMTEFDLDIFSNNLNKLIDYVGKRNKITTRDIDKLVEMTKKYPLFDFTNALVDQNLTNSLSLLESLLSNNVHPLEILSAIKNIVRNLILAKDFILTDQNKTWHTGQAYNNFKLKTIETIKKYDSRAEDLLDKWDVKLGQVEQKLPKKHRSSLFLLGNKNAYSVYLTVAKADKLSQSLLLGLMSTVGESDVKLKSTNSNPKNVLKSIIFSFCKLK